MGSFKGVPLKNVTWQLNVAFDLRKHGFNIRAVTSQITDTYNCIAYAAGDTSRKWWPSGRAYWPGRVGKQSFDPTLQVFQTAFATLGYVPCSSPALEDGYEKVALYGKAGEITHAAIQLPSGYWSSKLGDHADVEHDLEQIAGALYGNVVAYLRRPKPVNQAPAVPQA